MSGPAQPPNPANLAGVRVLELSRYIAAPVTGKLLGELGADVVKIESPGRGDPMRYWQSGDRAHSPQFAIYNRTKRGITLDLKNAKAKEIVWKLIESADIVAENFKAGVIEKLGFGYEAVAARVAAP